MANQYNKLFDFADKLGIGGDFEINPEAVEDVYAKKGYDLPMTMPEVRHEVLNIPLPKTEPSPVSDIMPVLAMKPIEIKLEEPKKVSSVAVPVVKSNVVPSWATALSVSGFPIGLLYGIAKGSGFWGVVGFGIVGGIVGAVPYSYYKIK